MLEQLSPGHEDAVHGPQQTFRCVLDAMSRPGRVYSLPAPGLAGIGAPGCQRGSAAVLLTLLDAETSVHLAGRVAGDALRAYFRFHAGVVCVDTPQAADFVLCPAADVDSSLWSSLALGSDEMPQHGATLVVEVNSLNQDGVPLELEGPGIQTMQRLRVAGLSHEFWSWRQRLRAALPRGLELILVDGQRLAAIPRSTRVTLGA